ncbi:uncharacterized protein Z520_06865 [Fonsecaea multimorphosa CBS 102226]|uniref:Uncharacterized protein n=1 Tax=Fonsecaea multimorphosa CBS 102226 TaxID=1442371 RepID=A0A0D2KLD6_9EURO|nr:uncharacterized protein Z520_06865 [Fonsecaea multimorphosa CBS 102226]KIX97413.1 hypothetical protein Z520_06865 [Fonsecaea multimorphosa CBS 102226]OAL23380.1 hypothetical protein AYO22_06430 [Fonsecaea multimorphosa]
MFVKSSVLCFAAALTTACAARIPAAHNYGIVTAAEYVHDAEGQQFLVTDITKAKPHTLAPFTANFFSNSCNNGFIGQVQGQGGANCVKSIPGTKGIALLSQPAGCQVTVYTDDNCSSGATLLSVGQCLQETETGIPSYSIDGNC